MRTERVKALVWREWRLSRKYYLTGLAAILGLTLLFVLFELSMRFGNMKSLDAETLSIVRMTIWGLALVIAGSGPGCSAATENGVHKSDIQANWLRYSYALPITPAERAGARMLLLLIVHTAAILLSVLGLAVSLRMLHLHLSIYAVLFLLAVMDVCLIVMQVQLWFLFRARDMKTYSVQRTRFIFTFIGAGMVIGTIAARSGRRFAEKQDISNPAFQEAMSKIVVGSGILSSTDWLNLFSFGNAESIMKTAKHLLPLTVPLTVLLYVLMYLVIRSTLKGAWKHDRSAL